MGQTAAVWVDRGTMRLPTEPSTPIVMVGPGTGLAIFKAFLEERLFQQRSGVSVGACCVVVVCYDIMLTTAVLS